MNEKIENKPTEPSYIKKAFKLIADYFLYSDERLSAWLLLIGAILAVIALVAIMALFSWWTIGFWAALVAKDLALLLTSSLIFGGLVLGYVVVNSLRGYLIEALSIQWRYWLTSKFVNKYIKGDSNFLDLMRLSDQIENPEQRIQEDVDTFIDSTLNIGLDLLKSTLSLGTFIGTLWVVGGALSFFAFGALITIPGYLVWVAIAVALITTLVTHLIGSSLSSVNNKQENLEADFRKEMQTLNTGAESITQEQAQPYYQSTLSTKLKEIYDNSYERLGIKTKISAFQDFCSQIPRLLPYLASAPLYFIGQIELGQLMQVGMAFSQVNSSLGWFAKYYDELTQYETSIKRLVELEDALEGGLKSTKKAIQIRETDSDEWGLTQVNIGCPSSTDLIMRGLNLNFTRGENTLIKAPSGLGKSTLFKIIAGSWHYGTGDVLIPNYHNMCFLPQKPILPNVTLRAVLAYPDPADKYTEAQYIQVLQNVGGNMDEYTEKLDQSARWSDVFSLGQQQRISFARALLRQPDWLFLDEATASVDLDSEQHLYRLIQTQLPKTTVISIAHRPTLNEFHQRMVTFKSINSEEPIQIIEEPLVGFNAFDVHQFST